MMLLSLHLIACAFMTGLIWVIQILHYPAFAFVEPQRFSEFHHGHSQKISYIVVPVMLLELVSALGLVWRFPQERLLALNLFLVFLIWLSTGLFSVPMHQRLAKHFDLKNINRLVMTNWFRTALWSLRLLGLGFYFYSRLKD